MVPSVIADNVAGGGDLAGDLGMLGDVAADQEKRGADLVPIEDIEQARGPGIVGTIVEGEGQLPRAMVGADEGSPEELGARSHGVVAGGRQGGKTSGGGE
jgi:hypothetical protein